MKLGCILGLNLATAVVAMCLALSPIASRVVQAQEDFSIDPSSPQVPGTFSAADVIADSGTGVVTAEAALGLPPGSNIDAFSHGIDEVYPMPGSDVRLVFSVSRTTIGLPGPVFDESTAAPGNGAAGDKFLTVFFGGTAFGPFAYKDATGHGLVPDTTPPSGAPQDDLDALKFILTGRVYFSVDPATAAAMAPIGGTPVHPADILTVASGGSITRYASRATLGLAAGDDIDALLVNDSTAPPTTRQVGDAVHVSLTPGSTNGPPDAALTLFFGMGPFIGWAPAVFGLGAAPDDLNAMTTFDPGSPACEVIPPELCAEQLPALNYWATIVLALVLLATAGFTATRFAR